MEDIIKFEFEEDEGKPLLFADVEEDQFFVATNGFLYQKVSSELANCIASKEGTPYAVDDAFDKDELISRILPRVTKIRF